MDDLSGQEIRGYKIIERIGAGGFGVVYRAEQPSVDREVAIKVILPEYANHPEFIQRFEAEARVVARLEHFHIVPLYDYWREEEGAYLVMRWLRGGSLREALKEGPRGIEAADRMLGQIAEALSVAHKQGVVHRDLKPENILLDEEGNAYLTDFGIAKDIGGEGLTKTGKMVGSVDYLAPEQAKGEGVTPKTDIYGLGVVLYEVLVGEHPFPGLTPVQLLQAHLNQPLPSIGDSRPELPESLNEVIQRATAKDPGERYSDVIEMVEAYRQFMVTVEATTPPSDKLHIPAFLEGADEELEVERPVFVARERELESLVGYLEKALASQGQVVFVTGGAGRGKTAVVDEFCRRAQEAHKDLIVATGTCNAQTGIGDPYLPFRDVFSKLTGDVEAKWASGGITRENAKRLWEVLPLTLDALLARGPSLVDVFIPGEVLLAHSKAALPPGAEQVKRLEDLREQRKSGVSELEQSLLFEQCTNVLNIVSNQRPLLLFMDDFQWADDASISLLFHLGRRIEGNPILVLVAYRPDEVALGRGEDKHPLEGVVNELKRKFGDILIDLSQEEKVEDRAFIEDFLDTEPNRLGAVFRQALYDHTGGHPLFTIELLRAMQERGDLVHDEQGRWVEGASLNWDGLPPRVEAVIEERIGRLEENLREMLSVASVEGEDFTAQVIARVQDVKERLLLRDLSQELEKRHRLVREQEELRVDGKLLSRYRFAHHLLQRYLYNDLSAGERRLLHGEIACILEELFEDNSDVVAVQLAFHYGHAENAEKELQYLIQAGHQALAIYANQEAESYYRRALNLADSVAERAELLSGIGEALFGQSNYTESIQTWREGIELYQSLGAEGINGMARLYARSARAAWNAGDTPGGLELCQEGLEAIENAPESYETALLVHEAGRAYHFNGIPEEAEPLCRKALEAAERLGALDVQADVLATYGVLPDISPEEALESLTRAVEIAETTGLLRIAYRAHNNLGFAKGALSGDLHGALDNSLQAVETARKLGSTFDELFALSNVFDFWFDLGELTSAEEALPGVEQMISSMADPTAANLYYGGIRVNLMMRRGQWMDALKLLRTLQKESHQRGDLQNLSYMSIEIAKALIELNRLGEPIDLSEAEAALMTAIEISDRGLGEWGKVWPRCLLAIVRAHQGRFNEARLLCTKAQEIADPKHTIWDEGYLKITEAELALAEKRWPESIAAFEVAAGIYERMEMLPRWARILMLWAEVHISRGEPGDFKEAQSLLQKALSAYKEMDITFFVELVENKLEGLQAEATD
jgi:tetratricopeptide (TPR) repeat protein/predicted Ser/Thr protein kinase